MKYAKVLIVNIICKKISVGCNLATRLPYYTVFRMVDMIHGTPVRPFMTATVAPNVACSHLRLHHNFRF
jgi:hypothetical protein